MDWILNYIKNVVLFLLVMTVVLNLCPKTEFEKYVRMFAGFLLLLLVMQPLLKLGGQESFFEISPDGIELETVDLQKTSDELERKMIERLEGNYEAE
jgi:stage III sporulation protein AF